MCNKTQDILCRAAISKWNYTCHPWNLFSPWGTLFKRIATRGDPVSKPVVFHPMGYLVQYNYTNPTDNETSSFKELWGLGALWKTLQCK